jgi:hypothetical protein
MNAYLTVKLCAVKHLPTVMHQYYFENTVYRSTIKFRWKYSSRDVYFYFNSRNLLAIESDQWRVNLNLDVCFFIRLTWFLYQPCTYQCSPSKQQSNKWHTICRSFIRVTCQLVKVTDHLCLSVAIQKPRPSTYTVYAGGYSTVLCYACGWSASHVSICLFVGYEQVFWTLEDWLVSSL